MTTRSKSGYRGVIYIPSHAKTKPWKAYIRHSGQYITIGHYKTKNEAAMAFNRKARELFGSDAYFNPIISSQHSPLTP